MLNKFEHINNFIFDMDGTIVDSSEEVLQCLKQACNNHNAEININNFSPDVIGPPIKEIIKNIIVDFKNETLVGKIITDFRKIYDNDENDQSQMYEMIFEWLKFLKNSNKRLFLATNKPAKPTERLIKMLNLNMFEEVYTIDKYPDRQLSKKEMITEIVEKYNLTKAETLMVGDAPSDIKAAHLANIKAIGVLWGYGNEKETLVEISDYIINVNDLKILQKV